MKKREEWCPTSKCKKKNQRTQSSSFMISNPLTEEWLCYASLLGSSDTPSLRQPSSLPSSTIKPTGSIWLTSPTPDPALGSSPSEPPSESSSPTIPCTKWAEGKYILTKIILTYHQYFQSCLFGLPPNWKYSLPFHLQDSSRSRLRYLHELHTFLYQRVDTQVAELKIWNLSSDFSCFGSSRCFHSWDDYNRLFWLRKPPQSSYIGSQPHRLALENLSLLAGHVRNFLPTELNSIFLHSYWLYSWISDFSDFQE